MKKVLSIFAIATLTASVFGQGFAFSSTKGQGTFYTPEFGAYANGNSNIMVGFMWAAPSTASAIGAGSATNYNGAALTGTTWTTILNDPNFRFATNGSSLVTAVVNNSGVAQGGWGYALNPFVPVGTTAGNTYSVFAVAWSSLYANPWAAAAANSFLGWSSVIQYVSSPNSSTAAPSFAASSLVPFGIITVTSGAVPEPSTMALAALGGASLFLFRRRK